MTGGTLTANKRLDIAAVSGGTGTLNVSGGQIT